MPSTSTGCWPTSSRTKTSRVIFSDAQEGVSAIRHVRVPSFPARSTPRALGLVAGLAGLLAIGPACGKKGPPLAPLLRLPAAVEDFAGRRLGSTAYLRFKIPAANQDGSRPADIGRIEVYAISGTPATSDEILKKGTMVATIPVRRPAEPDEQRKRSERGKGAKETPGKTERKTVRAEATEPGFDQGATVTVTEEITAAMAEPVPREAGATPAAGPARRRRAAEAPVATVPETRVYVAVGFNRHGRRGVVSPRITIPLAPPGEPPTELTLAFTEQAITLAWKPSADERRPVQEAGSGKTLPSKPLVPSALPTRYNVYAVSPAPATGAKTGPAAGLASPPSIEFPVPLNDKPLAASAFEDKRIEFGTERCYVVRTVNGSRGIEEESPASAIACVTPKDIFPPAPPRSLAAVWSNGGISLNWEPNTEPDLAGYIVLRGEAAGGALQRLMEEPVRSTTWLDTTGRAGVRYVYAVVAVDSATPPNVSAPSNKVEETAR
jgi:hypothetical protein